MARKKITVGVSEELLAQVDSLAAREGISRSEFIRRAMNQLLDQVHTMEMGEKMRKGYAQMAQINLEWAEMGLAEDMRSLDAYIEKLSECE